jgi:hypothetical protein
MDPEEIEKRQFIVSLRGYARDEVESFREEVAQEIKILRKQLTKAISDLSHANTELSNVKSQLSEANAQLAEERSRPAPEPEPKDAEAAPEDRASVFRMVGQETERILLAAEQAADQIHERAVAESAAIMSDARTKVEQSLAEFEAARRAAEEDFAGIQDSRAMVASQLEDIRRRLEETIGRLRVPVELPGSKPVSRFRQPEADRGASQAPIDRRQADEQAQLRQQREMEAAKELQARQTAHRGEAERREKELQAVQAEVERRDRADAERRDRDRAAAEAAAAKKAQQAAELQAAVSAAQEAERLKNAREAERQKASEDASAAVKARAAEQAAATAGQKAETEKAEAAAKARSDADRKAREQEEAERSAKAKAEADRVAKAIADAEAAARTAEADEERAKKQAAPAKPGGEGGSSLDDLLAEIRRKREEEEGQAGSKLKAPAAEPAAPAAAKDDSLDRRSEALGELPAQTARRLKRLLQEDHNDLLDRIRTHRGKGPVDDNLASQEEQLGRFVAGLKDALGRAFAEGRKAGGARSDTDPLPAITKLVTRQVVTPLRTEVSNAIAAGLEAEDSASALSERANDVFRVWKGVRTQLLGEGIAYSAYHQGLLDVWRTKAGSTKQWVFSDEEAECPKDICRRNADKGAVPTKDPFPSGHLAPPAHGGCTCTLKSS